MTSDRKKPTAGFWITVALVAVLVGYPLSFGPAAWLVDHGCVAAKPVARIYRPILVAISDAPAIVWTVTDAYIRAGSDDYGWTGTRIMDAAGLIPFKTGHWPDDPRHDIPHRSSEHCPGFDLFR